MESQIQPDIESQMFQHLYEVGCCYSCCLRLIGVRKDEYYNNPETSAKMLKYIPDDQVENTGTCVACVGILQRDSQSAALKKILEVVEASGYDSSTFTCALPIPISLSLRDRSLHISSAQKFQLTDCQLNNLKAKTQNVKDVWKTQILPKVEAKTQKQFISGPVPSQFSIEISFIHIDDQKDCKKLLGMYDSTLGSKHGKRYNDSHNRNNIEKILNGINDDEFKNCFPIPPPMPTAAVSIDKVSCSHGSIFIGGRYSKFSRQLSQTPWFINGQRKMETSVQDLLCGAIVQHTKADAVKFLSSGREDVDVRTINSGRPFAMELTNPQVTKISSDKYAELVDIINASTQLVQITSELRLLSASDLKQLKEGENAKTKFYRALCTLRSKSKDTVDLQRISNTTALTITQKTPIRVLHRRPLMPRARVIHKMRARWLTPEEKIKIHELFSKSNSNNSSVDQLFVLDIKTQAGTYVKEFVHGDFGRTRPSLCDVLGTEVDIVALDVTGININWP